MNTMRMVVTEVCRLCLVHDNLVSVFHKNFERDNNIRDVIFITTGVKICFGDNVSTKICGECFDLATKMFEFRRRSLKNDNFLQELWKEYNTHSNESGEDNDSINEEKFVPAKMSRRQPLHPFLIHPNRKEIFQEYPLYNFIIPQTCLNSPFDTGVLIDHKISAKDCFKSQESDNAAKIKEIKIETNKVKTLAPATGIPNDADSVEIVKMAKSEANITKKNIKAKVKTTNFPIQTFKRLTKIQLGKNINYKAKVKGNSSSIDMTKKTSLKDEKSKTKNTTLNIKMFKKKNQKCEAEKSNSTVDAESSNRARTSESTVKLIQRNKKIKAKTKTFKVSKKPTSKFVPKTKEMVKEPNMLSRKNNSNNKWNRDKKAFDKDVNTLPAKLKTLYPSKIVFKDEQTKNNVDSSTFKNLIVKPNSAENKPMSSNISTENYINEETFDIFAAYINTVKNSPLREERKIVSNESRSLNKNNEKKKGGVLPKQGNIQKRGKKNILNFRTISSTLNRTSPASASALKRLTKNVCSTITGANVKENYVSNGNIIRKRPNIPGTISHSKKSDSTGKIYDKNSVDNESMVGLFEQESSGANILISKTDVSSINCVDLNPMKDGKAPILLPVGKNGLNNDFKTKVCEKATGIRERSCFDKDSMIKENIKKDIIVESDLAHTVESALVANDISPVSLSYVGKSTPLYICNICNSVEYSAKGLRKHRNKHTRCQFCKARFRSVKNKMRHLGKSCIIKNAMNNLPTVEVEKIDYNVAARRKYHRAFIGCPPILTREIYPDDSIDLSKEKSNIQKIILNTTPDVIEIISDHEETETLNKPDINLKNCDILNNIDNMVSEITMLKKLLKSSLITLNAKNVQTNADADVPDISIFLNHPAPIMAELKFLKNYIHADAVPVLLNYSPIFKVSYRRTRPKSPKKMCLWDHIKAMDINSTNVNIKREHDYALCV